MARSSLCRIGCQSPDASERSEGFSPLRSYACGCRGPSMATHAVGGWVRYRCEARPSNASRPCSSSNVPSGRPTCACLVTRPLDKGNIPAPPGQYEDRTLDAIIRGESVTDRSALLGGLLRGPAFLGLPDLARLLLSLSVV